MAPEGTAVHRLLPLRALVRDARDAGMQAVPGCLEGPQGQNNKDTIHRLWAPRPVIYGGWAVDICTSATWMALPASYTCLGHTYLLLREGKVRLREDREPPVHGSK